MSYGEEPSLRPRRTVLPPLSSRTLQHPSFLPLDMPSGLPLRRQGVYQTACPLTPSEVFYSDPTMGFRIQNTLTGTRVCDCSQLNTPEPIMSARVAPPNHPDPFRSGPHPIRDLGSPTWMIQNTHLQLQPLGAVVQLTQEEDQAITNLLKLHHQEGPETYEDIPPACTEANPGCLSPPSSEESRQSICCDTLCLRALGQGWSETGFEVANTLQQGFNQEENLLRNLSPCQKDGSETSRELWRSLKQRIRSKERLLTDLEEDAVCVLLSLRECLRPFSCSAKLKRFTS